MKIFIIGIGGFVLSLTLNIIFKGSDSLNIKNLLPSIAFGLAVGTAYTTDRIDWSLFKKLGISLGIAILFFLICLKIDENIALESGIKYCLVFVFYNILASFRKSKSLKN